MTFPIRPPLCAGCLLAAQAAAQSSDTAPSQQQMQTSPRMQTQTQVTLANAPLTRAQVREAFAQARSALRQPARTLSVTDETGNFAIFQMM